MNYFYLSSVWLLGFWLAFLLAGYSWWAALSFAAIGAIAGGLLSTWWQTNDSTNHPTASDPDNAEGNGGNVPEEALQVINPAAKSTPYQTFSSSRQRRQSKVMKRQSSWLVRLLVRSQR